MTASLPDTPRIEMWFDFASPYSYLAIERIDALAQEAGVEVDLRPFLLGPIFQAQGWNDTPFRLFPGKGAYMRGWPTSTAWSTTGRACSRA